MPNEWIEKLKRFNADGYVWAIPKKNTEERKMLDRGQRFKYSLLKERFPDLAKQLEEEVSSREAKAKMRKAEELIKQAEAIDNVVKRRKLRILPKEEEEEPPQLESAEAPIRPENKNRKVEEKESPPKTDSVEGNNKMSIYNKMEGKTIEGPKTATEYYYYLAKREEDMPKKLFEKYADEQGMSKEERRKFLNNINRFAKQQTREGGDDYEEVQKKNEEHYKQWLKDIDWKYNFDASPDTLHQSGKFGSKQIADKLKEKRDELIMYYRKEAEEKAQEKRKKGLEHQLTHINNLMEQYPEYKEKFEEQKKEIEEYLAELEK